MKRLTAILLLTLLAFNWFGYRIFMNLLEQKASAHFQKALDRDQYDENKLVEVKIPLNLPYQTNWTEYEKFEGETEFNGVHFKYVKRKLVNDTLILICIANGPKNELRTAQSEYFKQINDLQGTSKKSNSGKDFSCKVPIADYLIKEDHFEIVLINESTQHHQDYFDYLSLISRSVAEQPPEC